MGSVGNVVIGVACIPVLLYEQNHWSAFTPKRGENALERAARLEKSPRRAAAMERGRRRLAAMVEKANPGSVSLALLRLKAGLSQTQLAEKLGTKQGNVSRWENDPCGHSGWDD